MVRGVSRADLALAAGLALVVVVELPDGPYGTPLLWGPLTVAAMLTLAWRRVRPVEVALVVCAVQIPLAVTADGEFPPQLPVLGALLAVYTAGACLAGRTAVVVAVATLALLTAAHWLSPDGDTGDFLPFLVWGAPWLAGRLVRRRTLEAEAAGREAAELVRRRDDEAREAVASERDRIARELHDVVAHAVSLMVVQAGAERLALKDEAPRTRAALEAIETAGREALGELRTMLAVLRAPGEDAAERLPQPDLTALESLAARVRDAGVTVDLAVSGDLAAVPSGVALSAYRVVQEALTNAVKHAAGGCVAVRVDVDDQAVRVDARSPLSEAAVASQGGRGLVGIRERAALLGGTATAGPEGGSWVVHAVLPLNAAPVAAR